MTIWSKDPAYVATVLGMIALSVASLVVLEGCDARATNHVINVLEGRSDPAEAQAFLLIPPSEEASSAEPVAEVTPPEPVVCENYDNRFYLYDCHGNLIGPDPKYW